MHISIADDLKKQFHAACALRGLKMSQVITELVEQWLKANEISQLVGESLLVILRRIMTLLRTIINFVRVAQCMMQQWQLQQPRHFLKLTIRSL